MDLAAGPTASLGFEDDERSRPTNETAAGAIPKDFPSGLAMPAAAVVENWGSADERRRWVEFKVPNNWDADSWQAEKWRGWRPVGDGTWQKGSSVVREFWSTSDGVRRLRIEYPAQAR